MSRKADANASINFIIEIFQIFDLNLKLIHKFFESFATDNKHKKTPGRKKQKVYQIINAGHASHLLLCNKQ